MVFYLVTGVVAGCGGEVDSDQRSTAGPTTSDSASNTSAGGSANGGALVEDSPLADCGPGFTAAEASDARPCRFFVGTTCYSTQAEACGCVCPRDQGPLLCVADGNAYLAGTNAYGVWCVPKS
jgi:hypothetical protein